MFGERVTISGYIAIRVEREPTLGTEAFAQGKRQPDAIGGHAIELPGLAAGVRGPDRLRR